MEPNDISATQNIHHEIFSNNEQTKAISEGTVIHRSREPQAENASSMPGERNCHEDDENPGTSTSQLQLDRRTEAILAALVICVSSSSNEDDSDVEAVQRAETSSKPESARNKKRRDIKASHKCKNGSFPIKCRLGNCKQSFESVAAKMYHSSTYHAKGNKKTFNCHLCEKSQRYVSDIEEHMRGVHAGIKSFKCPFTKCTRTYTQKGSLTNHINAVHTKKRTFNCTKCPRKFYFKAELNRHHGFEHGEGIQYCCYLCERKCMTKHKLQKHMNAVHTHQTLFMCRIRTCRKMFTLKVNLKQHTNALHTKEFAYKCKRCPKKFYYKSSLTAHLAYKHGEGNTQRCDECQKIFSTKQCLRRHMRSMHSSQFRFKCTAPMCCEAFATKKELTQHTKDLHNGKGLFKCEKCSRELSSKFYLTQHLANKHGEGSKTRYTCDICQQSVSSKRTLHQHMGERHNGQFFFQCSVCSKGFVTKCLLQRHLKGKRIACSRRIRKDA